MENCFTSNELCEVFFDSIMNIIGVSGTLIVPSYTYSFPNGSKFEGEFRDGKWWNGAEYDKNGNITGKWVNGEIHK